MSIERLGKLIEQVRQLEALAKATPYPEEADACTRAAERLIADHRLRREVIDSRPRPVIRATELTLRHGTYFLVMPDGSEVPLDMHAPHNR